MGKETTMTVRMTARHFELTHDVKRHVETRSTQFERFFGQIIDLHWTLEVDKHRHLAETSAQLHGTKLTGHGEGADMRTAVDEAANRMEAQLKKYKSRLKEKDHKAISDAKTASPRNVGDESEE
jgi:putative sigma-54 modulation protein